MTFYCLIFVLFVFLNDSHQSWYTITKFAELPIFYLQLRTQNSLFRTRLTAEEKYEICWRIIRPSEADLIRPEEHERELRKNHKDIFKGLFRRSLRSWGLGYKYENRSKLRRFSIKGIKYAEMTFICVVRSLQTNEIVPYYISDYDYNVNEVRKGRRMSGRFVFVDNQIYALAEECPNIQTDANRILFNKYYMMKHEGHLRAAVFNKDPICKLDSGRQLRLCTYVSRTVSADPCQVSVEACETRQFSLQGTQFDEWMLTCKLEDRLYKYASRSYESNEIFVFKNDEIDGKLILEYNLTHVSVIIDDQK